jgi:Ca2+-binding RTX toxin-like protein
MFSFYLAHRTRRCRRPTGFRPRVECLEDRAVPATLDISGTALSYTAAPGENNAVTISTAPIAVFVPGLNISLPAVQFTIQDSGAPITLTSAAVGYGWSQPSGNSHTAIGPDVFVFLNGYTPGLTLNVNLVDGVDTLNVNNLFTVGWPDALKVTRSGGGSNVITLGNKTNPVAALLLDPVTVTGGGGATTDLTVDDSSDTTSPSWTVGANAMTGGPQPIHYSGLSGLTFLAGSGLDLVDVPSTGSGCLTTLVLGSGGGQVDVQGTTGALNMRGTGGIDSVFLGSQAPSPLGTVQGIQGQVGLQNLAGPLSVTVEDGGDTTPRPNVVLGSDVPNGGVTATLSGLSPAPIFFLTTATTLIELGNGGNTVDVSTYSGTASVFGGSGTDTLVSSDNADFALSDSTFQRTLGGLDATLTLRGFEQANLTAGSGDDRLDASLFSGSVTLTGGPGDDTLLGGTGGDLLVAGTGDTYLSGGAGNDTLLGGPGDDTLLGGSGNDSLDGGSGNDSLSGGSGDDYLTGGGGFNSLDGGSGNNRVVETADADFTLTNLVLTGNPGLTDTLANIKTASLSVPATSSFNHTLNASTFSGAVFLTGGSGNDTLLGCLGTSILSGGLGINKVIGGHGQNVVVEAQDASFTLTNTKLTASGVALTDTLSGIQQAQLTNTNTSGIARVINASGFTGPVVLTAGVGNDTLIGGSNNDALHAGPGSDVLIGGPGRDSLVGGPGQDLLIGGSGSDSLTGGNGSSILVAGKVKFYNESTHALNAAALGAIMAEWTGGDTYTNKVAFLSGSPGGANGTSFLNATTVANDLANDTLTGGPNLDWFVLSAGDLITNLASGEAQTNI